MTPFHVEPDANPGVASRRSAGRSPIARFLARRFYFVMTLLTIAVVLIGFLPTLDARLIHPHAPRPLSLYVHTAIFTGWLCLLLVQSGLVQAGKVSAHRNLGIASSLIGLVLPAVGIWVAIDVGRETLAQGNNNALSFLLVPLFDMVVFTVFFALGWWWRRRPELHRRLILVASVSLTVAAFARFPRGIVGGHFNVACDILLLVAVARDLVVDRRVHRVYLVGLPLLFVGQACTEFLRHTATWLTLAGQILGK